MTCPHTFRSHALLALCLALAAPSAAQSVDPDFLRMWEAAQRERPALVGSRGRLVSVDEPGTPLVIHGRVLAADGRSPVAGLIVFAYQTDRNGHYDRPNGNGWRLKGWARTDADGRFSFDTIRPGAYPGRTTPAHVHVGLDGPQGQRHTLQDVLFEDDPLLGARERERARRAGDFGNVRPVRVVDGRAMVDMLFRLPGEFIF